MALAECEVAPYTNSSWKSHAPLQFRFFTWLASRNRCQTSDHLARRGLPHQDVCPLCDQHDEKINHILLNCVFARTVWHTALAALGGSNWVPRIDDNLID